MDDWYQPYNKPGAVLEYFKHNNPKQEWVVVLDPDMLLHKAFQPKDLPLERGWAYAAHYDYLIGTNNALAARHIPEVAPRWGIAAFAAVSVTNRASVHNLLWKAPEKRNAWQHLEHRHRQRHLELSSGYSATALAHQQ